MFAFSDEHKMFRQMVRKWVEAKLVPANPALDKNELLPYDLMRDFGKAFGLPDLVRAGFDRMAARVERKGGSAGFAGRGAEAKPEPPEAEEGTSTMMGGGDPALQAIIA